MSAAMSLGRYQRSTATIPAAQSNTAQCTNTVAWSCLLAVAFVGSRQSRELVPVTLRRKCEEVSAEVPLLLVFSSSLICLRFV